MTKQLIKIRAGNPIEAMAKEKQDANAADKVWTRLG